MTCNDNTLPGSPAATVLNVDTVYVDLDGRDFNGNPSPADTVVIDNTNGRVTEPGATPDSRPI